MAYEIVPSTSCNVIIDGKGNNPNVEKLNDDTGLQIEETPQGLVIMGTATGVATDGTASMIEVTIEGHKASLSADGAYEDEARSDKLRAGDTAKDIAEKLAYHLQGMGEITVQESPVQPGVYFLNAGTPVANDSHGFTEQCAGVEQPKPEPKPAKAQILAQVDYDGSQLGISYDASPMSKSADPGPGPVIRLAGPVTSEDPSININVHGDADGDGTEDYFNLVIDLPENATADQIAIAVNEWVENNEDRLDAKISLADNPKTEEVETGAAYIKFVPGELSFTD
jgi:hypothetical protein